MYHHLVIGGRKQSDAYLNGSSELTEVLRQAAEKARYSAQQVRVEFYPWWTNMDDLATRLHLLRRRYKLEPEEFGIGVSAFSRGVGVGVLRLAGHVPWYRPITKWWGKGGLERFGLCIDNLTWCDGIYHDWMRLWRSLVGAWRIKTPDNDVIDKVYVLRQQTERPKGAPPILRGRARQMDIVIGGRNYGSEMVLRCPHVEMDDSAEYHTVSLNNMLDAAARFVPRVLKGAPPNLGAAPSPLVNLESKLENTSLPTPEPIRAGAD